MLLCPSQPGLLSGMDSGWFLLCVTRREQRALPWLSRPRRAHLQPGVAVEGPCGIPSPCVLTNSITESQGGSQVDTCSDVSE